jgi:hypothetical protein
VRVLPKAVAIAREPGAPLLELRAALSQCRLLRNLDRRAEAPGTLSAMLDRAGDDADAPGFSEAHNLLGNAGYHLRCST